MNYDNRATKRPILFRVWDKRLQKMTYDVLPRAEQLSDDNLVWMQASGIKDNEGINDIYLDDILEVAEADLVDMSLGVVGYANGAHTLTDIEASEEPEIADLDLFMYDRLEIYTPGSPHLIVIGNIWEDPDLLNR